MIACFTAHRSYFTVRYQNLPLANQNERGLFKKTQFMRNNSFLAIALAILASTVTVSAQHTLKVTVANIKETKGDVMVGLFDNSEHFLKKSKAGKTVKASANEVTVEFADLAPGEYAVSVIHDLNENGELDSNFMGIPNEPYGFSNNVMGNFGPPSFDKAKVVMNENKVTVINLR